MAKLDWSAVRRSMGGIPAELASRPNECSSRRMALAALPEDPEPKVLGTAQASTHATDLPIRYLTMQQLTVTSAHTKLRAIGSFWRAVLDDPELCGEYRRVIRGRLLLVAVEVGRCGPARCHYAPTI